MSTRRMVPVLASLLCLAGCAGSVGWDHCEPAVCGVDAVDDPVTHIPDIPSLLMAPGGSTTVVAVLDVQGAYEDTYDFSVAVDDPALTATIAPTSAEVLDGVPFEATVALSLADTVVAPWSTIVTFEAAAASDASHAALTSIEVEAP